MGTSGAAFQRRRQLFVFGRFLARLAAHLGDSFVVKGGFALELRLERARTTRDIDLAVFGDSGALLQRLQAAGQLDLHDFMTFEVAAEGDIDGDGVVYGGHHFKVHCKLGGKTYSHFPTDVVFGGALSGETSTVEFLSDLSSVGLPPTRVRLLPVQTHIAEKVHAYTLPRATTNFRVRDLPDIALLAMVPDGPSLLAIRKALAVTFEARATHAVPQVLPPPSATWEKEYANLAEENDLLWRNLADVYAAAKEFIEPVLSSNVDARWDTTTWRWEPLA